MWGRCCLPAVCPARFDSMFQGASGQLHSTTSPLILGPPGQGGDGSWQERSWQQERRMSPEEHRDSVSPDPWEAKTKSDTWGPYRLVYSHTAIFSLAVHWDVCYSENTTLVPYTCKHCLHTCIVPIVPEAHGVYVCTCLHDWYCLSELGVMVGISCSH